MNAPFQRDMRMAEAVVELRQRMNWSLNDLIQQIADENTMRRISLPHMRTIRRWESGENRPKEMYLVVLARLALKYGHRDLAEIIHPNHFRRHLSEKRPGSSKFISTTRRREHHQ